VKATKHRIGLIGCGGIARAHIEGYRMVLGSLGEVVAGCDPNPQALDTFCAAYGVPHRFADAGELIASGEVDVISLLTPPAVRSELIFPAVERGIHLLVEKPFAEKMADAVAFVRAAEEHGVTLAVNQQFRFTRDVAAAREWIASGELGEVRLVAHDQFQNRTRVPGWRAEEERLEISIFSIHLLDRVRWLAGRPPEAVTAATRHWNSDVLGETFTSLTIQFEGGAVGTMVSNWHSITVPECRLRVDGTEGSLLSIKPSAIADLCTLTWHRTGGEIEQRDCSQPDTFRRAIGESMRQLLSATDSDTTPPHSGRDNLQTMAIVDAAYLSASRGGGRVEIAEVWDDLGSG
jgi:predicted dehydrogenase